MAPYLEIFIPIEKMKTPSFGKKSEFGITVICGSLFSGKFQNSATQPYDATNEFHALCTFKLLNFFQLTVHVQTKKSFRLSNKQLTFSDLFTRSMLAKNWIKTRLEDWILEDCPSLIKSLKRFSIYLDSPLHSGGKIQKIVQYLKGVTCNCACNNFLHSYSIFRQLCCQTGLVFCRLTNSHREPNFGNL